jgi:hypothetical protein
MALRSVKSEDMGPDTLQDTAKQGPHTTKPGARSNQNTAAAAGGQTPPADEIAPWFCPFAATSLRPDR